MHLDGKITVITGGSEGLGEAIGITLAQSGSKVWLVARSEPNLRRVVEVIRMNGGAADYALCDVRSGSGVEACINEILARDIKIDILINNAGIWLQGEIEGNSCTELSGVFETNALGTIYMSRAILPSFKNYGSGHILNIISDSGLEPSGEWPVYAATKFAVHGFTESLRKNLEGTQIKVTGLYPGGINTNFYANAGLPISSREPWMMDKFALAEIVLHILSRPDDIVVEHLRVKKA